MINLSLSYMKITYTVDLYHLKSVWCRWRLVPCYARAGHIFPHGMTFCFIPWLFISGSPRAVRLIGPIAYIGQVQIFHENSWVSVCHDDWTFDNGRVVCQQLGYKGVSHTTEGRAFNFALLDGDQGSTIEGFSCKGNEDRLDLCPILAGNWSDHECSQGMAGVICTTPSGKLDFVSFVCLRLCSFALFWFVLFLLPHSKLNGKKKSNIATRQENLPCAFGPWTFAKQNIW